MTRTFVLKHLQRDMIVSDVLARDTGKSMIPVIPVIPPLVNTAAYPLRERDM
jgi:hypothetical protein